MNGATGIAFVNIENGPAKITLIAYDDKGDSVAAKDIVLNPFQKLVDTPEKVFSGNDIGEATYIAFSSDREVVGFQLNASSDGKMLDALPAMAVGQ